MSSKAVRDLKGGELIKTDNGIGTVSTVRVNADATVYVETIGKGRTEEKTFDDPHEQVKTY